MEKPAQHIIRNNLILLVGAAVVLGVAGKFVSNAAVMLYGALYLGQVAVNFLLGLRYAFSKDPNAQAAPYLLSTLLVLIIGFGACSGMLAFADFNL